jgi:ankyrin repeat protein
MVNIFGLYRMPVQTPEQRATAAAAKAAAAAAKAAAKVADEEFTELYKILMKEKNAGFDRATAIIGRLTVDRLNQPHKTGITVLEKAVAMKSIRIVEALLQKGVSVARRAPGPGTTFLYDAACISIEMVQLFLNRGIDINGGIHPAIFGAAGNKKQGIEIATLLLANGADINRAGEGRQNALMRACDDGNKKMVEFLLARGADVNVRGYRNKSLLFYANGQNKTSLDIFKMLLLKGVDINAVDEGGENVLMAHFNTVPNPDFVKFVAAQGLRLDIVAANGNNLLHHCLFTAKKIFKSADMKPCFDTAKFLIERGININARNNDRQTPLLYSLVMGMYQGSKDAKDYMQEALALPGIDVNLDGKGWGGFGGRQQEMQNISPLNALANLNWQDSITQIVNAGADVNFHDSTGRTILMYLVTTIPAPLELINLILGRPGADINISNPTNGLSVLHCAVGDRYINVLNHLIGRGANVNATDQHGFTPVFHAAYHGALNTLDTLLKLPAVNKNLLYDGRGGAAGKTLLDIASAGVRFTKPGVNEKIIELCAGPQDLWKGWSRANAAQFDSIFAVDKKEAADSSCCPVCLKTVVRTDGCVYIQDHNCSRLEGFYHKKLYEKYKSPTSGLITWCTLCGRICLGHRHYALGPANGPVAELLRGGDPFTLDCKTDGSGGGGLIEKLARYRRMREYALELQDEIGKKTQKVALEELVEEMWNAPMARKVALPKMMEKREWNIPASVFPLPPANAPAAEVDMATLPDIRIPDADREIVVPAVLQGVDTIQGDEGEVIQFHHRQTEGGLFHHENNFISADSLAGFIAGQNGKFKTDESFGLCWSYPGMCNGRLYPEEIERFFVDGADAGHDAELKATFAEYKKKFNWKFRARAGGKRSGDKRITRKAESNHKHGKSCRHSKIVTRKGLRKTKRSTKQRGGKQRGGEPKNVFVPATNAQCYLPPKKKNNTKKNNNSV